MKINAGKFKGKKLIENKFDHIRPTTDKVRQALFTKLQFFIKDKDVLDLFCGTGALGMEALSRGAKSCVFVDKDFRSAQMTRNNLKNLGVEAKVVKCDAVKFLESTKLKFDLILLDPPYKSGLYETILSKIYEKQLLNQGGVIVCEHSSSDKFDYSFFSVYDEKKYGNITLTYLEL